MQCKRKERPAAIVAGMVLHDKLCRREWLVLSSERSTRWAIGGGPYSTLFFDDAHYGKGINAALDDKAFDFLHVSEQGLIHKVKP